MRQSRSALINALSVQRRTTMQAMANNTQDVDVSSPTSTVSSFSSRSSSPSSSPASSTRSSSPPPLLFVTSPEQKVSKIVPPSPSCMPPVEPQLKFRLSDAVVLEQKRLSMMAFYKIAGNNNTLQIHSPRPVSFNNANFVSSSSNNLSTPRYVPGPVAMYQSMEQSSKHIQNKLNTYSLSAASKPRSSTSSSSTASTQKKQQNNLNKPPTKEKQSLMTGNWRKHQPAANDIYFVATPATPTAPASCTVEAAKPAPVPVPTIRVKGAAKGEDLNRLQLLTQSALKRNSRRGLEVRAL